MEKKVKERIINILIEFSETLSLENGYEKNKYYDLVQKFIEEELNLDELEIIEPINNIEKIIRVISDVVPNLNNHQ